MRRPGRVLLRIPTGVERTLQRFSLSNSIRMHSKKAPALHFNAIAVTALVTTGLGFATAAVLPSLPLPTTLVDYFQPGTQPSTINDSILDSSNCASCHGYFNPDQEPYTRWTTSMMAQASRDPIFYAALAVANQDASFAGDLCLRCHTPGAWLDGRSEPADGSALNPALGDLDGVTCHVCHRLVDPILEPGVSPTTDKRILDNLGPANTVVANGGGQYIIDPNDVRRGPFQLAANFPYHDWKKSPYHQDALLCATCHEVSNPTLVRQPDDSYQLGALSAPHPTQDKLQEFPIERTYSEWSKSAFAQGPIEMNGRFGGNKTAVSTCQDCHLPDTTGTACQPVLGGAIRTDLPLHDFNGSNSWVLDAVRNLYPDSQTGLTTASVSAAHARTQTMMQNAADLSAVGKSGALEVRVVNQSGHKLPSGYTEGRRMWIGVKFYDALNQLIAERGAYDLAAARLSTSDTKVYESKLGLDASQSAATGLPAGESFHFVLNNKIYKDNRIPPRGFTNAGFDAVQTKPVGTRYAEERYWDDTSYAIPLGATHATVALFHQTTSREYVEFLRDTNTTNLAGQTAYDQWVINGKSAPVLMQTVNVDFIAPSCLAPIAYGSALRRFDGSLPNLAWTGTASFSANNFVLVVQNGIPNQFGTLLSSALSASTRFQGGTLLLAAPLMRVADFQFGPTGRASIPITILPPMIRTELNYQAVFRDGQAAAHYGITNAVHVDFCP